MSHEANRNASQKAIRVLRFLSWVVLECSVSVYGHTNTLPQKIVEMPMAYQKIAQDFGIPPEVFFAVMLTESGKQISLNDGRKKTALSGNEKTAVSGSTKTVPWPWTLNVELKSYYFKTKDEAKQALRQFIATDNKRIAVGLGQIYLPSHGHLFPDVTELLEPGLNLHYAAKLLAENFKWTLDQGKPNWWVAVGRYHTPSRLDLAMPYREDVYRRCERLSSTCARYGSIARN
jgi:hypothetical protein